MYVYRPFPSLVEAVLERRRREEIQQMVSVRERPHYRAIPELPEVAEQVFYAKSAPLPIKTESDIQAYEDAVAAQIMAELNGVKLEPVPAKRKQRTRRQPESPSIKRCAHCGKQLYYELHLITCPTLKR